MTAPDAQPVTAVLPTRSATVRARPLDGAEVSIVGGFWGQLQATNRRITLPHGFAQLDRAGNLDNFTAAATGRGAYRAERDDAGGLFPFLDSDVYKWLEAVAWDLAGDDDTQLRGTAEPVIRLVVAAQREDGYLNTHGQLATPGREFEDLRWGHELYTAGHLIQAGVAWSRALRDDRLLDVACRCAARIDQQFGPGREPGIDGHPEVEMALVELFRTTGEDRWLTLARRMIEERGRGLLGAGRFGADYWQDHLPVRQARWPAGHAVRQLYLDCGATDVAVETGDRELLDAVVARWCEMVASRTYLTGGVGSHHRDESFGQRFELPPDRAYAETCAAIASVMLSWRLLLATGEERFADHLERTLFNGVLPSLAADGRHFFYVNPLQRRADDHGHGVAAHERAPWFGCACCPPNLMRAIASMRQLLATRDEDGVALHQFADADLSAHLSGGRVRLSMRTGYPWQGDVHVRVQESPTDAWPLRLRVPAWCSSATVQVPGDGDAAEHVHSGMVSLRRQWRPGDEVILRLDLEPRWTSPDPRIDAVRGCIALERGPLVYAFEQAGLPDEVALDSVTIVPEPPVAVPGPPGLADDIRALEVTVVPGHPSRNSWPYTSAAPYPRADGSAPVQTRAVPYFAWGNRGRGAMRVWMPTDAGSAS